MDAIKLPEPPKLPSFSRGFPHKPAQDAGSVRGGCISAAGADRRLGGGKPGSQSVRSKRNQAEFFGDA
ncbi:hypothetical protein C9427_30425 [Mesorhizobium helmanticense]|uniref:Uncharacterized protein n=1 Tax=Mesorhizobium helmanticense TaxID=1776423 RepID=A0A2T4ILY7_9HYPH|nr:hypothetical protein C9427_30425 [Mesorhizobium helmanticense]